jgi:putative Mg2+ transporter-C (MgtC) family protein
MCSYALPGPARKAVSGLWHVDCMAPAHNEQNESGGTNMDFLDVNWQEQLRIVGTVLIAAVLGGVVGMEREMADRPAGLRTHAILAAAACLLVSLPDALLEYYAAEATSDILRADPIRVVEAVVTGTAFLGAGTIFRDRDRGAVEGLTTAASLLLVGAIGISVALKQMVTAVLVTVLTLLLLRAARWFKSGRR